MNVIPLYVLLLLIVLCTGVCSLGHYFSLESSLATQNAMQRTPLRHGGKLNLLDDVSCKAGTPKYCSGLWSCAAALCDLSNEPTGLVGFLSASENVCNASLIWEPPPNTLLAACWILIIVYFIVAPLLVVSLAFVPYRLKICIVVVMVVFLLCKVVVFGRVTYEVVHEWSFLPLDPGLPAYLTASHKTALITSTISFSVGCTLFVASLLTFLWLQAIQRGHTSVEEKALLSVS